DCTLCELPTGERPVTDSDIDGQFCCRGCLEVYRTLGDVDIETVDAADLADTPTVDPELGETTYLSIDGMHCKTCELFIESIAREVEGVYDAESSYATDMVRIQYDPKKLGVDELASKISKLGYRASLPTEEDEDAESRFEFEKYRSVIALLVMMPVMAPYILFIYPTYLGIYPREFLYNSTLGAMVYAPLFVWTTLIIIGLGYPTLRGAYVSLTVGQPNMDVLIALAVLAAYVYSGAAFALGQRDLYFDVAVMILVVVTVGNHIESRVKRSALGNHSALTKSRITSARKLLEDGSTETVDVGECSPGDRVLVKPGERIPVDGVVIEGTAAVDEALMTGESLPQPKSAGEPVLGGSVVTDSALVVEVGETAESTLEQLVELLWNVKSSDSGMQRLADRFAVIFVPLVIVIALLTAAAWFSLGLPLAGAILIGVSVLVISCPCSLGIATPLALASGTHEASERRILLLNSNILERITDSEVIVFDKTGTLTTGEMSVERTIPADGESEREVLAHAAAVEGRSSHPVGEAISEVAGEVGLTVEGFERGPRGVSATVDGREVTVGHPSVFETEWDVPGSVTAAIEAAFAADTHPTVVGWDGAARGVITIRDTPREGWKEVVSELASAGRKIVVLTGDDERMAKRFSEHPNVDDVFAGVRPESKEAIVGRLRAAGTTTMIGDGTNDAPALASADLGIAMSSGTELAMDAADAVVMDDDLAAIPEIFEIARSTKKRIRQNLGWAIGYNLIAIPLAVLGYINPLIAAVIMAISSLIVVANSGRRSLPWFNAEESDGEADAGVGSSPSRA
ncbi:MAG: cation-translocating P-type ATPase, partial [Halalkalicoccus sp.]